MSESNFGELLNQHLQDADRSASWVAGRLGVNPSTVTRWLNNESRPREPDTVIRLADVLGVHDRAQRAALLRAAGYAYVETAGAPPVEEQSAEEQLVEEQEAPDEAAPPAADPAPLPPLAPARVFPIALSRQRALLLGALLGVVIAVVLAVVFVRRWLLPVDAGERHFAIGEWQNLSTGASPYENVFTGQTRDVLYQKLSLSPAWQGVSWRTRPAAPQGRAVDIWIEGSYQQVDEVQLSARLFGSDGVYLDTVNVAANIDAAEPGADVCILDLQTQLAAAILAALQTPAPDDLHIALASTPTHSCQALRLNNEAAPLILAGNYAAAQQLLERALRLDPDYADAHNNLAQVHERQGQRVLAVKEYGRAIELQPQNAIYHFNLGRLREGMGDLDAAIDAYTTALELDPLYVRAYNNLAFTHLLRDELDPAADLLRAGLRLDPAPDDAAFLHKNLGRVHLARGEYTAAVQALQRAMDAYADAYDAPFAEALYYLALTYEGTSETDLMCATLSEYANVAATDEPERSSHADALRAEQCERPS